MELEAEKVTLKNKGYTYRSAAPVLGVSYPYLSNVLNGHSSSLRLMEKIRKLPKARKAKR